MISQSLDLKTLRLNNRIGPTFKKISIVSLIDSIVVKPETIDLSDADSIVYIGNSSFECFKLNGNCRMNTIVFDNNIKFLTIDSILFNKKVNSKFLKNNFPKDCKKLEKISIYNQPGEYETSRIPVIFDKKLQDLYLMFF